MQQDSRGERDAASRVSTRNQVSAYS